LTVTIADATPDDNDLWIPNNFSATLVLTGNINLTPTAHNDSPSISEDSGANTIDVLANDTDPDNDALTITSTTQGGKGSVAIAGDGKSVTYTPSLNANGNDSFEYTISDGNAHSATATVNVSITPVNDAPTANDGTATTNEDTAKAITLTGSDADGDSLTYSVVTGPTHGTLSGTAPNLTYTPNANYNGPDSFTFKANDGTADSADATVSITMNAVNDAPTVTTLPNFLKMDEGSTLALPAAIFDARFADEVEDDPLQTAKITTLPVNGVLQLNSVPVTLNQEIARGDLANLLYAPNPNYYGSDSFGWNGSDGTEYAAQSATVKILINDVNDAPVLDPIADQLTSPGNTLKFTAQASDVDDHRLRFSLEDEPSGATINANNGKFIWIVPNLPSGVHYYSFTVRVTDKGNPALSDEQEVNVTVISGVFFSVTPTYDHGGAQLVFRLYNGTQRTMTNIGVNGNLRGTLGSLTPSKGTATTRLVNPSTGVRSLTWNGFTLAPGEEAQLVVDLTSVTPGQTIASDLRASYKLGGNRGDTRAPSIVYNNIST
jgi:hypothetical protein